jgi:hypothetical protein
MKKSFYIVTSLLIILSIIIIPLVKFKVIFVENNTNSNFSEKEIKKFVDKIYTSLMDKNVDEYVNSINEESINNLDLTKDEISNTVKEYLNHNKITEYKITSIEDFDENTKIVNTSYKQVSDEGTSTEHGDVLFIRKNDELNKLQLFYNGAISSRSFETSKASEGEYKFSLRKIIRLLDGVGVSIEIENKADSRISLGYGTVNANVVITTTDGKSYNLPLEEIKIYNKDSIDKIVSYSYDTTEAIYKVEVQGVFELNENGTPKNGSPKTITIYEE